MCGLKKVIIPVILFTFPVNQALAYPEFNKVVFLGNPYFNISGPADASPYGTMIMQSGSTVQTICNSTSVTYDLAKIVSVPVASYAGRTMSYGTGWPTMYLFDSGVSGFSIAPTFSAVDFNSVGGYLTPETTTLWSGKMPNASRKLRINSQTSVYKDETRIVGTIGLPQQTLVKYLCQDSNGVTQEAYNFIQAPITISGTVTGCTPDSSSAIIDMDKIPQSTIEAAGATTLIGTKKYTASLMCDPDINVYVSVVDLSDKSNVTNIASLTADSTAKGVGFAVTNAAGQRLMFGPDGSAKDIPGQQKYFIQKASSSLPSSRNNRVSTQFGFSYVRKTDEPVKAGTAKAVIGLTYSYQ